jgi:hypothetical protein
METLAGSRLIRCPRLGWGLLLQSTLDALPIMEHLDISNDRDVRRRPGSKGRWVNPRRLQKTMPRFNHGVIVTCSWRRLLG